MPTRDQLAALGAMFAPDPFTAFASAELTDPRKIKPRDRRPDLFTIWLAQLYQEAAK